MRRRRYASLFLALALCLSLAAPAAAYSSGSLIPQQKTYTTAFTDTKGTWCDGYVKTVYETGLMDGKSANSFDPGGSLTGAQIIVITARLHHLLNGGDGKFAAPQSGQSWYQPYYEYLLNLPQTEEDLASLLWFLTPDSPCDRYDFVWLLSCVLPDSALTAINSVNVLPDTSDSDIMAFYNAGILTGNDEYGTFHGFSSLTRAQAAAMLARIVDPSQRVKFTPKTLVYAKAILGLDPDTVMLTVDGVDLTAEAYAEALLSAITSVEAERYFAIYEEYPEYYDAWLKDLEYTGGFAEYLLEKHGIDAEAPIDWTAPDKGGMTPAQKVLGDTRDALTQLGVLLSRQGDYPLTGKQKIDIALSMAEYRSLYYGFSDAFIQQSLTAEALRENLAAAEAVTPAKLNSYLADNGYVYGQYVILYRAEGGWHQTDAEAKTEAEAARKTMSGHLSDPDYLEYVIWTYSDDYVTMAGLFDTSGMTAANQAALKNLRAGSLSSVLTEEDYYLVFLKGDPAQDEGIQSSVAAIAAEAKLAQWAVEAKVATSAAWDAVDVAAAAQACASLFG